MVVQHNLTAMNSNRLLGLTTSSQAKSTEKLSSGYKINRAADDASGLSISEKMRKQIRGLTQASTNAQDGISAVQTAEGALAEVHDMLQRMNELAVKAANGTNSEDDRQNIQDEISQLVEEIDRVAETTKFNETYLLKGDITKPSVNELAYVGAAAPAATETEITNTLYGSNGTTYNAGDEAQLEADLLANSAMKFFTETVADMATDAASNVADWTGTATSVTTIAAGVTLYDAIGNEYKAGDETAATAVIAGGTDKLYTRARTEATSADYTLAAAAPVAVPNEVKNNIYLSDGTEIAAGNTAALEKAMKDDPTAKLFTSDVASQTEATDAEITVTGNVVDAVKQGNALYDVNGVELYDGTSAAPTGADLDVFTDALNNGGIYTTQRFEATSGVDYNYTADAADNKLYDIDGNGIAENGLQNYVEIKDDGTVAYKEDKMLYTYDPDTKTTTAVAEADLANYVDFTQTATAALDIDLHVGADATANNQIGVKIEAMSARGIGIDELKVTGKYDDNALDSIETIKAAIQRVSGQRSLLGAAQNRLEHTITNLDNIVENTTAAESQIRDTDMATEMVKYSNNNILAQAGQSMLAQANQGNQGVLSLLG